MTISLGIYDLFAYLIPGLLYLFAFNEFLRTIGWKFVDISSWLQSGQSPSANLIIPALLFSYVVGHVIENIAHWFFFTAIHFFRIRKLQKVSTSSLQSVVEKYPDLRIKFEPKDWDMLFTILRHRNIEVARIIDKFQADTIMLRNIAFGLFLLAIIEFVNFALSSELTALFTSLGLLVLSVISFDRSAHFREWFFAAIFKASLEYGKTLKEVVEYERQEKQVQSRRSEK
jgi:hypothetical protein